jgi:hypothetical protein
VQGFELTTVDTRDKIRGSAHETLVFGTYSEGRNKSDEIRGSAHWTATEIDELSCERITAFYKDDKPVYEDEDSGSGRDIANETDPYQSAVDLRYYGMWPSDSAVDAVVRNCEGVKKRMKSAGGAEIVIRAATFPLGFVLVTAFGILVGRCSACCRRNVCHSSLPTIGRLSLYLLAFILCVDLACLALYARTFPDMDDEKVGVTLNSIVFALNLPVLIQEHVIVAVGDIDLWEVDRGGFGCAVFAWGLHMFAILLVARAVKSGNNTREFDGLGAPRRKGWGRWYRPERENDAMPPDVATAAPRALQMPSVAEHFKTGVAGSIPDEDDDASTDVSVSDVSEVRRLGRLGRLRRLGRLGRLHAFRHGLGRGRRGAGGGEEGVGRLGRLHAFRHGLGRGRRGTGGEEGGGGGEEGEEKVPGLVLR